MSPLLVLCIAGATLGAWLVVCFAPPSRRLTLEDRIAPYLRDGTGGSRLLDEPTQLTPFVTLERVLGPTLRDAARALDRWLGGATSLRRRLDRAGSTQTVDAFRIEQLAWGAAGVAVALTLLLLRQATGAAPAPLASLALCLGAGVLGYLLRERVLTAQVAKREERVLAELPTVAELLALAVTAGEGPVAALERVCRTTGGALAEDLRVALADARNGTPLVVALQGVADRSGVAGVARFVDGVVVALERGTPLGEVLRAQALDAREAGRRALLESGGKREIAMLVPVVFLVLPVTVLFALFPGFYGVELVVG